MIITNLIIDKTSTNRDLQSGQTWLDTTNNIPYLLTWKWGEEHDTYALVHMSSGEVLFESTDINMVFGDFPEDFKEIETELVIRELI